mgnify:CR=1 FL=1
MVPGFYFSQISNLKSPIRGFIFRKPGFIFRKISHILVCFYTVNSQKCPKYPKNFARSARGFIFRKSQISNSRFGVLFFANLKYKIPYRGFKKGGGFIYITVVPSRENGVSRKWSFSQNSQKFYTCSFVQKWGFKEMELF